MNILQWAQVIPTAAGGGAVSRALDALERRIGRRLPQLYRDMAPNLQGRCPPASQFRIRSRDGSGDDDAWRYEELETFLIVTPLPPGTIRDLYSVDGVLDRIERAGAVWCPIARDAAGNAVGLQWSAADGPSVVYVDLERPDGDDVFDVAPSFEAFVAALEEPSQDGSAQE